MEAKAMKRKSSEMPPVHNEEKKQRPATGITINLSAKPAVPKVNLLSTIPSSKTGIQMSSTKKPSPIAMKLGASQKQKESEPLPQIQSSSVAAAFNEDSDEDVEEMPKSAKMRMKNIGRDTPTSSGPKSFNKTKTGFQNTARNWEREIDEIGRRDHERNKNS